VASAALASAQDAPSVPDPLWFEGSVEGALDDDDPLRLDSFSKLAARVESAVVNIDSGGDGMLSFMGGRRAGSGFIIHPDGWIVTNHHVVEGSESIRVTLEDERDFVAEVIGSDAPTDLALIKIDATGLEHVVLGNSDGIEVAEWVMAIGSPLGLEHTVTVGVVSALDRENPELYENFIQTDASINPGNSGGPLFNIHGEVIGINTAINPQGQGIGFAIPINVAKTLLPQLASGRVQRSWIGVMIRPVGKDLADERGIDRSVGALVTDVVDGGPAASAGIESGDIIVKFNGSDVDHQELRWLASTTGVGKEVRLELIRGDQRKMVELELREFDEGRRTAASDDATEGGAWSVEDDDPSSLGLGIHGETVGDAAATDNADEAASGLRVTELDDASPARRAGLRVDDIIVEIENREVASVEDARSVLSQFDSGDVVRLKLRRGEARAHLAFVVP